LSSLRRFEQSYTENGLQNHKPGRNRPISPGTPTVRAGPVFGVLSASCLVIPLLTSGCSGHTHSPDQIKRSLRKVVPQRMAYDMNYPNDESDYHVTEVVEKDATTYLVKGYWEIVATRRAPDYDFRNRKHNKYREKQPFEVKATLRHSATASETLGMGDFDYEINVLWKRGSRVRVN